MKNTATLVAGVVSAGVLALGAFGAVGVAIAGHPTQGRHHSHPDAKFTMVRSTAAATTGCLPHARAKVKITELEGAEKMEIHATGLVPKTEYDLFVIQVPDAPFGMAWYQGDLETDRYGEAEGTFMGRFNEETFSVAPGVAPAPVRHTSPIADASANPATAPVHQYHLGLWFNSPEDAAAAGCGTAVTPFNGEHNAGVQVLSTRNFAPGDGPLGQIGS
jgi:hypothetical protein